ncbi:MAG: riboflavin biosynthesis protein RibF [Paludibacteraceae bacterium]
MTSKIATIGYFDGVHRGHRCLFGQLRQWAAEHGLTPAIYTFYEHPKEVVSGVCPPLLTIPDERFRLLEQEGEVHVLSFAEIRSLTAAAFMHRLHEEGVSMLLMGYDHHFGSDLLTDFRDYVRIGSETGIEVVLAKELAEEGLGHVSSSSVRRALLASDVETANRMLGYTYSISGEVVRGNAIGRTIGFPTANLDYAPHKLLPPAGVYAGKCVAGETDYPALVNIGTNPTVGNRKLTVEGYLAGFEGDLYGQRLCFELERFIRGEQKFNTLEELREQIEKDLCMVES